MGSKWISAATFCALTIPVVGCEYFVSDVATRIRYHLGDAMQELQKSNRDSIVIALRPDHWPDACPKEGGYRLVITPYRGGKNVAVGDIRITCSSGHPYWTGLGSEKLFVTRELSVNKRRDEDLRITLRKVPAGIEITQLD